MYNKKIEQCFIFINDNWNEEEYKKCELEWKQIQSFISIEQTPYQCSRCNTYWLKISFINDLLHMEMDYGLLFLIMVLEIE